MRQGVRYLLGLDDHGGASGLARHLAISTLGAVGYYRPLQRIDWPSVRRLAFVCKGNICRSPYAEAKAARDGFTAISFGLDTRPGSPADASAIRNSAQRGLDLSGHRSRLLAADKLLEGDLVVCFEPWHVTGVRDLRPPPGVQVTLAGLWCNPRAPSIPDPYGRSDERFQTCYGRIDLSIAACLQHMTKQGEA